MGILTGPGDQSQTETEGVTEADVILALCQGVEDPILRLQIMLHAMPVAVPMEEEILAALRALARYDEGQTRELSGFAAWLDFLRDPYTEDAPLGDWDQPTAHDQELSAAIRVALDFAVGRDHSETAMPKPIEKPRPQVVAMPARIPELAYRPDAAPPFDAFVQLSDDREFKKTWAHKRTDLPDQSTDTYDRAVAGFAIRAGWTDQQVVDLVVYHRTQHVEPLKFGGSYYTDLLAQAKAASTPKAEAPAVDSEGHELLEVLNRALKIEIRKIVKYGGNGGTFELQLADGHKVDIGDAATVLSQRHVRAAIADATTDVVPALKANQWDRIAAAIFKCAGPAPIEEAPETVETRWLVRARLRTVAVIDIDERDRAGLAKVIREDAQGSGQWAFRNQEGQVMVQLGGLLAAIRLNHGILLSFKEGGKRLRKLGWKPKDLDGLDANGRRACINVWVAPRNWEAEG